MINNVIVIIYIITIIKGIIKEIFWVKKSEMKKRNKNIGILNAIKDNIVGRKLHGPNNKFPLHRI